ncbi:MFS transporter [Sphingomonas sp. LB3N6]|uniref:MFS transporter n=1 Tax=Sphingomonas fucosidasi TaxID=3096164 RepID=UPI002FCAC112
MSQFQWVIVAIMIGLNALDGFDVLSISFASPGIVKNWGIDRAALGLVLSMELIGMAIGSIILGGLADRLGRRKTILGCLIVMAAGMFAASTAHDVATLSVWRVLTGLGIGGMLATTNAAVSEASNVARRNLAVVLMAAGYPLGAILGGAISSALLQHFDWPIVFQFGGVVTLCFIPIVLWRAPESIAFEMQRRGPGTLAAVNGTLARMGHRTIDALPAERAVRTRLPIATLFSGDLVRITLLVTLAYTAQLMTFYFLLKWVPKIVVDMGFAPSSAGTILVFTNCGGLIGSLVLGLLTVKVRVRMLTMGMIAVSAPMVSWFGHGQESYAGLALMAAITGFFTNGGIVGLYAMLARSFPTGVRATATGFAIGVGRGGSALAPALAGFLFAAGYGLQTVAILMASGSVIALLALLALGNRTGET